MPGSEHDEDSNHDDPSVQSGMSSPPSTSFAESGIRQLGIGARSSSPAKRSASERDHEETTTQHVPSIDFSSPKSASRSPKKTLLEHVSPMPSRFKSVNGAEMRQRPLSVNMEDEEVVRDPLSHSGSEDSGSSSRGLNVTSASPASTPATSTDYEAPASSNGTHTSGRRPPSFDDQLRIITSLVQDRTKMKDGSKGYVISSKWILRVKSRTSEGLHGNYPKSSREDEVGPVDNSEIVLNDHFYGDLKDENGHLFVPLRSDVSVQDDLEIVPEEAWNLIMQWYGVAEPSHVIVRYARTTSAADAVRENLQYELFPPICTIQKLRNDKEGFSIEHAKEKDLQAINIVASRTEGFQDFLTRLKVAVGIDMSTKVRVWKLLETGFTHDGRSGMPTPVSSRSTSPVPQISLPKVAPKLIIDLNAFTLLEEGTRREKIDINDETANTSYNGHVKLDTIGFPSYQTLILEEQVRPGDDFVSDGLNKAAARSGIYLEPGKATGVGTQALLRTAASQTSERRSPTPSGVMTRGRTNKKGRTRGCTGLVNLGNTCYMNSALQCIRSVEELSVYFLEGKSRDDLNPNNPLGHNGQIAKVYESFIHSIFEPSSTGSFAPRNFKGTLGRCQPLFSGYGQQDSQEFLSFLVDGLHEDLNRVIKKPYMENPESDDKTVHDPEAIKALGEKFRENHRARNDSVAMDLFNGFYKNTMVCPVCDKISVTFDPYSLLTLQLPIEQTFQHTIAFISLNRRPIELSVDIDKNSTIFMLKEYVGKRVHVPPERLVLAEMYANKFYKVFENADVIAEAGIQSNDKLLIYELSESPTNWPPLDKNKPKQHIFSLSMSQSEPLPDMDSPLADRMAVPIVHRLPALRGIAFDLWPSFVLITREEARDPDKILRKVLQRVQTMTTLNLFQSEGGTLSESASHEGSDTVVMADEENSSSDEPHVQAESVESEESIVDVSMDDPQDYSDIKGPKEMFSATDSFSVSASKVLDPSYYIQPELRRLFSMHVYSASNELIPCGYTTLNETSRLPPLESRANPPSRPVSRRQSAGSKSQTLDRMSPESSEDELGLAEPASQLAPAYHRESPQEESDDEDSMSQLPHGIGPTNGSRFKTAVKKAGALKSLKNKKKGAGGGLNDEYYIRLGEGLVLDWSDFGNEQLFSGTDGPDGRGSRTDHSPPTLPDPELEAKRARRAARKKTGVSLEECFEETAKTEILSEENAWYCNRCKELRRATKKLEIWTVPDILVVHLKRFSTNSRLRDKIDVLVDSPVDNLDLTGKVGLPEGKSLQYDLFAVDNHYGGLGGGHYTAYARNFFDNQWYEYNDQMVSSASPDGVVTRAAYLLFYRRRSDKPLGGKFLEDLVSNAWTSPDSTSMSGEESRPDDSLSSGSSSGSLGHGAEVSLQQDAPNPYGPAGGRRGLESTARSALDGQPPAYGSVEYDEGISMEDDPDDPLPGFEDQQRTVIGPQLPGQPTWGWNGINEGSTAPPAPPGSGNSSTLGNSASDKPVAGESLQDRLQEDFGAEMGEIMDASHAGRQPSPENDHWEDHHVQHVNVRPVEHCDDEEEVTEIKLSSDTEEGP